MTFMHYAWRWWRTLCVAFVTTFLVLLAITTLIHYVSKPASDDGNAPEACLDQGGTWDAEEGLCRTPA